MKSLSKPSKALAINLNFKFYKNPTPHQLAFWSALSIAGFVLLVTIVLAVLKYLQASLLVFLFIFVCSFIAAYQVFSFALKTYIYRKIKLIYKNIRSAKMSTKETLNTLDMNEHLIDAVEQEVKSWTEDQQKEIDTLKRLESYRRDFLGNVSHEIKTPIFNIQGYVLTLLEGGLYDDNINMSFLHKAAKNLERLNTIVEDLDIISSLESGQMTMSKTTFSIRKLTEEVFEELEILAQEKNIKLYFKEGASQPFMVVADRERIWQVLVNLITNAIKYNKEGGVCKVAFYDMDSVIMVEVADNGLGIPQEKLKHVFDRFYRVDKARSRGQGGSGLGLAIVKHIIEAHDQTINVRSTLGEGSTFGFTVEKA